METLLPLVVHIVCGLIGGVTAGIFFRSYSLGPLGNILAGIVGGGLGGLIGAEVAGIISAAGVDGIIIDVLFGGVGGGGFMLATGLARKKIHG